MSPGCNKALSFVLLSVFYWVPALIFLGMSMLGDCFEAAEICERSKQRHFWTIVAVEVTVYVVAAIAWMRLARR